MKYKILIFSLIFPVSLFANTTGQAVGDGNSDQAIPHGLGSIPEVVVATLEADINDFGCRSFIIHGNMPSRIVSMFDQTRYNSAWSMDATNFYLDNNIGISSNGNLCEYSWIAFETSIGGGGDPSPIVEVSQGIQAETYATTLYVAGMSSLLYLTVATVKRFRQKKRPGGR